MFDPWVYPVIGAVGLVAGLLGGMLGVGGSTVMIPGLVVLFGQGLIQPGIAGEFERFNQHLYQAAAMIVNVAVALPATRRHISHKAVMRPVVVVMLPAAVIAILIGVAVSNLPLFRDGAWGVSGPVMLGRIMAVFLVYVIIINVRRLMPRGPDTEATGENQSSERSQVTATITTPRCLACGIGMGLCGGLTGIGGGAIAVPMQQLLLRLPLRNCIANSLAVMCVCAAIGATYKNATLGTHGLAIRDSLLVAALLIPTAMAGGYFGARLTHTLPQQAVRAAFCTLMLAAAWKMAAL